MESVHFPNVSDTVARRQQDIQEMLCCLRVQGVSRRRDMNDQSVGIKKIALWVSLVTLAIGVVGLLLVITMWPAPHSGGRF
jgi:hypothetical protein